MLTGFFSCRFPISDPSRSLLSQNRNKYSKIILSKDSVSSCKTSDLLVSPDLTSGEVTVRLVAQFLVEQSSFPAGGKCGVLDGPHSKGFKPSCDVAASCARCTGALTAVRLRSL